MSDKALVKQLRASQYGCLLPDARDDDEEDDDDFYNDDTLPFNLIEEVRKTLHNQGYYPSVKVSGELLPTPPDNDEGSGADPVDEESDDVDLIDSEDEGSDEDRSVAGSLSDGEEGHGADQDEDEY